MSEFKKGQPVKARTLRGTTEVKGKVTSIDTLTNGVWITVQPEDKNAKPIRTRPACVTAA